MRVGCGGAADSECADLTKGPTVVASSVLLIWRHSTYINVSKASQRVSARAYRGEMMLRAQRAMLMYLHIAAGRRRTGQ
jgi:hypothetical protein